MSEAHTSHASHDPEGYFRFCQFLMNQFTDYLRKPVGTPKNTHARNQELYEYELTVTQINPYSPHCRFKPFLDKLSEIAEQDQTKSDVWRGDTDVRIAKMNVLAYQHPYFNEIPEPLKDCVIKIIREKFPSVLKHPGGQRCEDIDPLLNRLWHPGYEI